MTAVDQYDNSSATSAITSSSYHYNSSSAASMTSHETRSHSSSQPNPADIEREITAHLTVNSLILLGFNTDEYIAIYSGIAFDITPLTPHSFDKGDEEKTLLMVLHYLLCILDREEFLLSIEKCWPFLDNKERAQFKKAVHISLIRLIETGLLPNALYPGQHLLNRGGAAGGVGGSAEEVWRLLHFLSDRAIDLALLHYRESHSPERTAAPHNTSSLIEEEEEEEVVKVVEDKALSSLLSLTSATSSAPSREALVAEIGEKVREVRALVLSFNEEKSQWVAYLEELDKRLGEAKRTIRTTEQRLRDLHLHDEYNILADQGKAKRSKLLSRLAGQKELLQSFLASPLLSDVEKYVEEETRLQEKEREDRDKGLAGDVALQKLGLANATTRRKMLSKEELEAYKISMRDAISTLVEKIEEVSTLV